MSAQRAAVSDIRLSAASMEHGSPHEVTAFVRGVLGGIDTDPASSAYWNAHTARAAVYYDRERDGRKHRWSGRTMVNAPGADDDAGTDSLVRPFWELSIAHWREAHVEGLVWVGFAVSQVGMLQGAPAHPLQFPTLFLCERLKFLRRPTRKETVRGVEREIVVPGPPVPGKQPTHYNFLTLLPTRRDEAEAKAQVRRFRDLGASLGAIVRPM